MDPFLFVNISDLAFLRAQTKSFKDSQTCYELEAVFYVRFPEGASLTVAAEEYIPHVKVVASPGSSFSLKGPMVNLLDILAKSMNFT